MASSCLGVVADHLLRLISAVVRTTSSRDVRQEVVTHRADEILSVMPRPRDGLRAAVTARLASSSQRRAQARPPRHGTKGHLLSKRPPPRPDHPVILAETVLARHKEPTTDDWAPHRTRLADPHCGLRFKGNGGSTCTKHGSTFTQGHADNVHEGASRGGQSESRRTGRHPPSERHCHLENGSVPTNGDKPAAESRSVELWWWWWSCGGGG